MRRSKTAFSNPWPSFSRPNIRDILSSISLGPRPETTQTDLQVVFPNFDLHASAVQVAWLGHASVYILLPHTTGPIGILFDPIFSKRYVCCIVSRTLFGLTLDVRQSPGWARNDACHRLAAFETCLDCSMSSYRTIIVSKASPLAENH